MTKSIGGPFICPLCGSSKYTVGTKQLLQDPVSKIFMTRRQVKECCECNLILYNHHARGWEGGYFDNTTGLLQYYVDNTEVIDGIKTHKRIQGHLPAISSIMDRRDFGDSLPQDYYGSEENLLSLPLHGVADTITCKKDKIYYIKSSLKGIEVLS